MTESDSSMDVESITHGADDNTLLARLDKESVLENMRVRYAGDQIYTYTGGVLLSVNPYKPVAGLYSDELKAKYIGKSMKSNSPHPFAVADTAYRYLVGESKSQAIIISGESGSGKTEAAKVVTNFIATTQQHRGSIRSGANHGHVGQHGSVGQTGGGQSNSGQHLSAEKHVKVLAATPILEAFGNATTIMNRNSSRFGKYSRLVLGHDGCITAAAIDPFLLESSRVTNVGKGERNFHAFYQFLAGAKAHSRFSQLVPLMEDWTAYPILSSSIGAVGPSSNLDSGKFKELIQSMDTVGFPVDEQVDVFSVLLGLLTLSQVSIVEDPADSSAMDMSDDRSPASFGSGQSTTNNSAGPRLRIENESSSLARGAKLLGLDIESLSTVIRVKNVKTINGARYSVNRDVPQAKATLLSLLRILYKRLFEYLVSRVNELTNLNSVPSGNGLGTSTSLLARSGVSAAFIDPVLPATSTSMVAAGAGANHAHHHHGARSGASSGRPHIGVLDIFGFESLKTNSFEQLCINLTNERLQDFFVLKVLEAEQKYYASEGVITSAIDSMKLPDASMTIHSIRSVLDLLDDHCIRSSRNLNTDEKKYCEGVLTALCPAGARPGGKSINGSQSSQSGSSIKRIPFVARDLLNADGTAKESNTVASNMGFIVKHYAGDVTYSVANWFEKNNQRMSPDIECVIRDSSMDCVSRLADSDACSYSCERFKSVKSRFLNELDDLMNLLNSCTVHYIRCFNPNTKQMPGSFDAPYMDRQIIQCGTVELVQVMYHGYPNRYPLSVIADRYQSLLPSDMHSLNPRDFVEALLEGFQTNRAEYAIGLTQLFLKAGQIGLLETLKGCGEKPSDYVITHIRRTVRMRKLKRVFCVVSVCCWFPRMFKQVRRTRLFGLGAELALTMVWILARIRPVANRARLRVRERLEAAERAEAERLAEMERQAEIERLAELERQRAREAEERLRVAEEKRLAEIKLSEEAQRSAKSEQGAGGSQNIGGANTDSANRPGGRGSPGRASPGPGGNGNFFGVKLKRIENRHPDSNAMDIDGEGQKDDDVKGEGTGSVLAGRTSPRTGELPSQAGTGLTGSPKVNSFRDQEYASLMNRNSLGSVSVATMQMDRNSMGRDSMVGRDSMEYRDSTGRVSMGDINMSPNRPAYERPNLTGPMQYSPSLVSARSSGWIRKQNVFCVPIVRPGTQNLNGTSSAYSGTPSAYSGTPSAYSGAPAFNGSTTGSGTGPKAFAVFFFDGKRLSAVQAISCASGNVSNTGSALLPSAIPKMGTSRLRAVAQHPDDPSLFACAEEETNDGPAAISIWRAWSNTLEGRFRIRLKAPTAKSAGGPNGAGSAPNNSMGEKPIVRHITFLTVSSSPVASSHCLAVVVECVQSPTTGKNSSVFHLVIVEVSVIPSSSGVTSGEGSGGAQGAGNTSRIHACEQIYPRVASSGNSAGAMAAAALAARTTGRKTVEETKLKSSNRVNFLHATRSGSLVVLGGVGTLMCFAVSVEDSSSSSLAKKNRPGVKPGNSFSIKLRPVIEQGKFPELLHITATSAVSIEPAMQNGLAKEEVFVGTADGNILRFPVLFEPVNRAGEGAAGSRPGTGGTQASASSNQVSVSSNQASASSNQASTSSNQASVSSSQFGTLWTPHLVVAGCGRLKQCSGLLGGRLISCLVPISHSRFYSMTSDGCVDQWQWQKDRLVRDPEGCLELQSNDERMEFGASAFSFEQMLHVDTAARKIVSIACGGKAAEEMVPRLIHEWE